MLTSLTLQNFALIEHHELAFSAGFNVITGETGAGKSLLLDALSLCAGGRADSGMVRHGQEFADIYAQFDIGDDKAVQAWFAKNERPLDDDVILVRRQLSSNGRSKAWLNGSPVSVTELKELSGFLLNIHSQHAQQALLKPQFVVDWLDKMAGLTNMARRTRQAYSAYQKLKRQADNIVTAEAQRQDRIQLLESQLTDIAPLLTVNYAEIEAEHEELSNLESLMLEASQTLYLLENDTDEPDVMGLLGRAIKVCDNQASMSQTFNQAVEQLYIAQQQISEATGLLADYAERQLPDPQRLDELNRLISLGHRLSRKHGFPVSELISQADEWQQELDELQQQPDSTKLAEQTAKAWQDFVVLADELHTARIEASEGICNNLVHQLKPLALPNARCEFVFTPKSEAQFNAEGTHDIELMFSANVGMPMQPLYKIASGGELSRMALVMQVLLATQAVEDVAITDIDANDGNQLETQTMIQAQPMLVFDEVDVGISGGTAQVVGELLRQLGQQQQLLAITHQAQVASQAHQHILVHKHHDEQTTSVLSILSGDAQVDELARMSGGVTITEVTREHARSLLKAVK